MKKILMIAYHFPPLAGSSGIQRTLRFVQHLPGLGWNPIVLTASARAYERVSDDLLEEIPACTIVKRAFALDAARHLAFKGRYIGALARPDRWMTWRFDGVRAGLALIEKYKPQAIWSTYPIPSAHVIAAELQRRSGLPWIADFRDPMAQEDYPSDPINRQIFKRIEAQALKNARFSTFTTPGSVSEYRKRYPREADRIVLLENGYDENSFPANQVETQPLNPGAVTLLHSGVVYPSERDPTALLLALRKLQDAKKIQPDMLKIRFRAAVSEALLHDLSTEIGVRDYLEILPPISYKDAIEEMLRADALLLLQASNCNNQVPAKLYEYLRARRPILCLTDPIGDTASVLRKTGIDAIAKLDNATDIAKLLDHFLSSGTSRHLTMIGTDESIYAASREGRTQDLVRLLENLGERPKTP